MINTMNSGFPRLSKFVAIFVIKIVSMFFNFQCLSNDMSGVIRFWSYNFSFVKANEMIRIVGVFVDRWLRYVIMEGMIYIFFETGFKISTSLVYVWFSTGAGNSVNSLAKHWIKCILSCCKYFLKWELRVGKKNDIF